jgi:hypothetical protein
MLASMVLRICLRRSAKAALVMHWKSFSICSLQKHEPESGHQRKGLPGDEDVLFEKVVFAFEEFVIFVQVHAERQLIDLVLGVGTFEPSLGIFEVRHHLPEQPGLDIGERLPKPFRQKLIQRPINARGTRLTTSALFRRKTGQTDLCRLRRSSSPPTAVDRSGQSCV